MANSMAAQSTSASTGDMPCHKSSNKPAKPCPDCPEKGCASMGACLAKCFQTMSPFPVEAGLQLRDHGRARRDPAIARFHQLTYSEPPSTSDRLIRGLRAPAPLRESFPRRVPSVSHGGSRVITTSGDFTMQSAFLRAAVLGGAPLAAVIVLALIQFRSPGMDAHADDVRPRRQITPSPLQTSAKSSSTAIRWACPTPRRCPRRIRWGWTTFPSTRAKTATTARSKSRLARSSAPASRRRAVGKRAITRTIKAPGVVATRRAAHRRRRAALRRLHRKRRRPSPRGTHVKKGDPLVTVFGQELLNQGARLLIEQNSGARGNEWLQMP